MAVMQQKMCLMLLVIVVAKRHSIGFQIFSLCGMFVNHPLALLPSSRNTLQDTFSPLLKKYPHVIKNYYGENISVSLS